MREVAIDELRSVLDILEPSSFQISWAIPVVTSKLYADEFYLLPYWCKLVKEGLPFFNDMHSGEMIYDLWQAPPGTQHAGNIAEAVIHGGRVVMRSAYTEDRNCLSKRRRFEA